MCFKQYVRDSYSSEVPQSAIVLYSLHHHFHSALYSSVISTSASSVACASPSPLASPPLAPESLARESKISSPAISRWFERSCTKASAARIYVNMWTTNNMHSWRWIWKRLVVSLTKYFKVCVCHVTCTGYSLGQWLKAIDCCSWMPSVSLLLRWEEEYALKCVAIKQTYSTSTVAVKYEPYLDVY